jgi:hypothetical protein
MVRQVATDLSPTNPYTTLIPLTIVFCITLIKQGIEDFKRHKADTAMNNRKASVCPTAWLRLRGCADASSACRS